MEFPSDILERAAKVELAVIDVDGVLSDGRLYYSDDGREFKAFHSRDGYGLKLLREAGITVAIITGRSSPVVTHRMASLGIDHVYQGQSDKLATFRSLRTALKVDPDRVSMIGDDVMDLPVMTRVGLSLAPADAHPMVRERVNWLTPSEGGRGAGRDLCDLLLTAHGRMDALLESGS